MNNAIQLRLLSFTLVGMGVVVVVCIRLVVRLESKRIVMIELMAYLALIETKTKLH